MVSNNLKVNISPNLESYKYCFVPSCRNTTHSTSEKLFISVPKSDEVRKQWCIAANCPDRCLRTVSYCCEDHFNLKEDLENYFYVKTVPKARKIKKKGVVPRFFNTSNTSTKTSLLNLSELRLQDVEEVENISPNALHKDNSNNFNQMYGSQSENIIQTDITDSVNENRSQVILCDKKIQVRPYYRSAGIQCQLETNVIKAQVRSIALSPIKQFSLLKPSAKINTSNSSSEVGESSCGLTESMDTSSFTEPSTSTTSQELQSRLILLKKDSYNVNKSLIETDPLLFVGIEKECYFIIAEIEKMYPVDYVLQVFKKIRLNCSNAILAYDFGISQSQVGRILNKYTKEISQILKSLIVWLPAKTILKNLSIQFRLNFNKVQSIIDCFEIRIEKPSNAVHQSATWSEYKKSNTIKYLISCTPDGLINFISKGYGGRTSDTIIVENCGYLDIIPDGITVLADRGFKSVEALLQQKNCTLMRPPSVSDGQQSTEAEVILTRQIASCRIHIERVIKRMRDFKFIEGHALLDHNSLNILDDVVVICAALVNLQSPIIASS
ncbi:uncharacterized protein LOC141536858 [Cotesia typhae]|uniref:uncharacterized protein LOC141536858 n=1 Tax=Cotesia typhae TaxID=2053667 RepID=UPI003D69ED16